MKKSNIAFSGFMAAILVSVGAANAATKIASQQYVDANFAKASDVTEIQQNVTEVQNQYTTINETVTQLGDTINNEESGLTQQITNITQQIGDSTDGLVKDINDAKTAAETAQQTAEGAQSAADALGVTVGNAESGLVKDVTDLKTQVGTLDSELDSKLGSETAATTYEVLTNKAAAINEGNQTSPTAYPSVGAIVQWTNKKIADLSDTGLPVNPGNIEDGTISGSKLENGAVTTDKIGADAVNGDKIADDSIGAEHIKDGAVGSDAIADGSVTEADLNTALAEKISGKEDKINKAAAIDSTNQTSTDAYPSVKAVYDWTTQQIANVEFDPSTDLDAGSVSGDKLADDSVTADKIAPDAVGSEQIADGAVTSDKLDETLAGQIADISNKQDKKMGVGHENHIVTTDASGNITSAATIAQSQVTGLTDALGAKLESDDLTGYAKTTDLDAKQNKNVGAENNGKILTVGADGNITTSATIAQARVDGLTDALADKVDDSELTTINQTIEQIEQNVTNITAPDSGLLAKKEDSANKKNSITPDIESSDTYFPTIGAMTSWVSSEISDLSELPVNPGLIENGTLEGSKLQNGAITSEKIAAGAVTTEKIANDAVTEDKLSNDVVAKIDAKADLSAVYTRQQTNDKIVEIAIQQPQNTCTSESDLCVLTLTRDKKLAWVPVTEPATAPVDAGPVMGSKNTDTTVD